MPVRVAELAGMGGDFDAVGRLEILEDRVGTGSADFWGISFSPCSAEHGPMGEAGEVERRMRSWTLPFLLRHSAYHTLDHAWEMEDKDLTVTRGAAWRST